MEGSNYACNKEYENLDNIYRKAGTLAHHVISLALQWFHTCMEEALSASRDEEFGHKKTTAACDSSAPP